MLYVVYIFSLTTGKVFGGKGLNQIFQGEKIGVVIKKGQDYVAHGESHV